METKLPQKKVNYCVMRCKFAKEDIGKVILVGFPKQENLRQSWVDAVGIRNWMPNKNSRLCSKHFHSSALKIENSKTFLKENAVPTNFKNIDREILERIINKSIRCIVPDCPYNNQISEPIPNNVIFRRFPKKEALLREWLEFVNKAPSEIRKNSFVCSLHFAPYCFTSNGNLQNDVVPTLTPLKDGYTLHKIAKFPRIESSISKHTQHGKPPIEADFINASETLNHKTPKIIRVISNKDSTKLTNPEKEMFEYGNNLLESTKPNVPLTSNKPNTSSTPSSFNSEYMNYVSPPNMVNSQKRCNSQIMSSGRVNSSTAGIKKLTNSQNMRFLMSSNKVGSQNIVPSQNTLYNSQTVSTGQVINNSTNGIKKLFSDLAELAPKLANKANLEASTTNATITQQIFIVNDPSGFKNPIPQPQPINQNVQNLRNNSTVSVHIPEEPTTDELPSQMSKDELVHVLSKRGIVFKELPNSQSEPPIISELNTSDEKNTFKTNNFTSSMPLTSTPIIKNTNVKKCKTHSSLQAAIVTDLETRLQKQDETINRLEILNDLLKRKHDVMSDKLQTQSEVIKKFQLKFTEILNKNFSGPKTAEEMLWDYDIEDRDEENEKDIEENNEEKVEENNGENVEENNGEKPEENSGEQILLFLEEKIEEMSEEITEQNNGEQTEENSGEQILLFFEEKIEENSGEKTEENNGEQTEENSVEITEENSGDKILLCFEEPTEENSGEKTEQNIGEKTEENSGGKTEENSGEKNKKNSGNKAEENEGRNTKKNKNPKLTSKEKWDQKLQLLLKQFNETKMEVENNNL